MIVELLNNRVIAAGKLLALLDVAAGASQNSGDRHQFKTWLTSGGHVYKCGPGVTFSTEQELKAKPMAWENALDFADWAPMADISALMGLDPKSRHDSIITRVAEEATWDLIAKCKAAAEDA